MDFVLVNSWMRFRISMQKLDTATILDKSLNSVEKSRDIKARFKQKIWNYSKIYEFFMEPMRYILRHKKIIRRKSCSL